MKRLLVFLISLSLLVSCSNSPKDLAKHFDKDKRFPIVQQLDSLKKTVFLTHLDASFDKKSNGIYSASLLMAWDGVKREIGQEVTKIESQELSKMNASKDHKKVLHEQEYTINSEVQGDRIVAKAFFKKSLPFIEPMTKNLEPLKFLKNEVNSFGFHGDHKAARILYYKSDRDFALKLLPKDKNHEIILVMKSFGSRVNVKKEIGKLVSNSAKFRKNRSQHNFWKYYFNDKDMVNIPILQFHLETNFTNIEGTSFHSLERIFRVEEAYQRTAFVLNEKGAEIESEALMEATEGIEEEPKPKHLLFDKPFLILLKRKVSKYPYFAMYVANPELMETK